MKRILIVEGDPSVREFLIQVFEKWNYEVDSTACGREAVGRARSSAYSLYLIAAALPDEPGIDLCRQLSALDGGTPIVVFSKENGNVTLAVEAGANAYVRTGSGLGSLLNQALSLIADTTAPKRTQQEA
ncbi:MAG TPA: response regulator [Acidobacteriota bacterium]|nr:response regulator [Acidobacteriota bacterium]